MSSPKPLKPTPANGTPTYDSLTSLCYEFKEPHDYREPDHVPEYAAAKAAVTARRAELAADPKLRQLEAAADKIAAAVKVKGGRLKAKADALRRRLLAEGVTDATTRLARELVADAEK